MIGTSQSESPCPRSSKRMAVAIGRGHSEVSAPTGLSQSNCKWLSQQVEINRGGPLPWTA